MDIKIDTGKAICLGSILIALSIAGTAESSRAADEDSVLLNCQGSYSQGYNSTVTTKPHSENIRIALDGSWIDMGGKTSRTNLSNENTWAYFQKLPSSLHRAIYFEWEFLGVTVLYKNDDKPDRPDRPIKMFVGSCTPFENPFQIPE
tara:strand:+ start:97 stop:537 length:441 start_codon:yes stop_codon:yes gene_type:complete